MQGLHILAEFHHCCGDNPALREAPALAALCRATCLAAGLTPVAEAFHQFPGAGATGALVLAESHLAVHTWPELNAVTLDLYVCNFSQDNRQRAEAVFSRLKAAFSPRQSQRRDILRGEIDLHHPNCAGMR